MPAITMLVTFYGGNSTSSSSGTPAAAGTDTARADPAARRKTCSGKDTLTLTVMAMGRRVSR